MKKCKDSFEAEFGFNVCGPTSPLTEMNSNPATDFGRRMAEVFIP